MTDPSEISRDQPLLIDLLQNPRKRRFTVAAVLVLACAIYSGWWLWLASEVRTYITEWQTSERANDREVTFNALTISGFPGALHIQMSALSMHDTGAGHKFTLPVIDAEVSPWEITTVDGRLSGPVMAEIVRGDAPERYTLSFADNSFRLVAAKGGQVDMTALNVLAERLTDGARMTAKSLYVSLARATLPSFGSLTVNSEKIDLPETFHSPFGNKVERLSFRVNAEGALPPSGPIQDRLREWTGDGGTLEVLTLDLVHGALGVTGEGTMALDQDLQPIGAFTARISGFNDAVDALIEARVVRAQDGALARVILGALAKVPPGGGPKVVEVPLSLQNRQLSVGPVPLMRVPKILW